MALHFHGNQYEQSYKPCLLRNWEVPKKYNDKPHRRSGQTTIISNNRGHLLPGVPKSKSNPWGNYVGTWHLPKKIDRDTALTLNKSFKNKIGCAKAQKTLDKRQAAEKSKINIDKNLEENLITIKETVEEETKDAENLEQKKDQNDALPYVPGVLTEDKHRLPSHEILVENQCNIKSPVSGNFPRYRDDFSKPLPEIMNNNLSNNEVQNFCKHHQDMAKENYSLSNIKKSRQKSSPTVAAIKNFQLAKKLHRENLEHFPLPDTIAHRKYKQLQMQQSDHDPGLALKNENYATGIGWKGYPGYGPTRCTKLKVYRPKTCGYSEKHEIKNDGRPSSVTSFDRKWRFIRAHKVTPIELAICWDLSPENPKDEPKRTKHLDGSNGSLAPAVFSLVHTPKDEENSRKSSVSAHESESLFEKLPLQDPDDKEFVLDQPKASRRTSKETIKSNDSKKRGKSAYNLAEAANEETSNCSHCNMHQSTPNLSDYTGKKLKYSRMCMACEMKNVSLKDRRLGEKHNEYKMALKAGVPHVSRIRFNNRNDRYKLTVPKQKDPYSPKNYAINSLAPPFSLQKDKRQDYPEHWRLATVYQHSYKPIHARKRPLLATVFK